MAEFERAAVIGTGTMGPGMGAVLARVGIPTAMYDVSADAIERARPRWPWRRGPRAAGRARRPGGSVTFESHLGAALEGADIVLEAVPERLEVKHEVFREFEKHVDADAVLASNTSGIPITAIAEACEHPERVIGTTGRTRRT